MRFDFLFCHGRSERCFCYRGYQFPLCARCSGIYIGFVLVLVTELYLGLPPRSFLPAYLLLIVPMGIDGTTQLLGSRESNNPLRLITGLLGGIGIMMLLRTLRTLSLSHLFI
ncbi:DUF2085 domain-containing protein [Haloarcula marismortui]|uniref:DUF2085 domain-containing protein n=1 Tax=Haloarcula marismortui TaxID=2238 RepID=UPI003C751B12